MGIKKFYNLFNHLSIVKLTDLKDKVIAIDASYEIYRSSLGSAKINELTDSQGNPTLHINIILHNVVEMYLAGIKQLWVFDHDGDNYHNPLKQEEQQKRKKKRDKAIQQLNEINELFSDDENDNNDNKNTNNNADVNEFNNNEFNVNNNEFNVNNNEFNVNNNEFNVEGVNDIINNILNVVETNPNNLLPAVNTQILNDEILLDIGNDEINNLPNDKFDTEGNIINNMFNNEMRLKKQALEKQAFVITSSMINDIKLILNCFNIHYIDSPKGYEAEQIAAFLSSTDQCDGVYSGDTDPIVFGAKIHYRKHPKTKKILKYTRDNILLQIEKNSKIKKPNLNTIRKIAVILGCDFAPKTPRIGEKTVLKKFKNIELTEHQLKAIEQFKKIPDDDIVVSNFNKEPFVDCNFKYLLNWLVDSKGFAKRRIENLIEKIKKYQILKAENA